MANTDDVKKNADQAAASKDAASHSAEDTARAAEDKYSSDAKESSSDPRGAADKAKSDAGKSDESSGNHGSLSSSDGSPDYGGAIQEGYLGKDDIDLDDKDSGDKGHKSGFGSHKLVNKAGLWAAAQSAMMASKLAMAAFLKMLLQLLMQMVQAVAAAVASVLAAIMHGIATIAAYLGISMVVAFTGIFGIVVIVAAVVVATVAGSISHDAERDTGNICTEPYSFVYHSTPTADTLDAARIVYSFFKGLGYTDTNIAGILGNWDVESGIDSTGLEGVYDEPFASMDSKNDTNFKKYKNTYEQHEVCKCKWLVAMIDRGYMAPYEYLNGDSSKPVIKYRYTLPDPDYDDQGNAISVTDRIFDYCYNCDEGKEHLCEHGYNDEHEVTGGAGTYTCADGWKLPCEHGFTVKHHVPAYHDIELRQRCLDWQFTPPGVMSPGCETGLDENDNVRWVLDEDTSIPEYDHENKTSSATRNSLTYEGFIPYDTSTSYDNAYCGIGLGQWTNGRNKLLQNFAKNHSMNWYDIECQLAFMVADDGDSVYYRNFLATWQEEPDPQQAALTFTKKWEGNTKMAIEERKQAAASWFVTISAWGRGEDGGYDASLAGSLLGAVGSSVTNATNVAASKYYEDCDTQYNANNSTAAMAALSLAWSSTTKGSGNDGTERWRFVKDEIFPNDGVAKSDMYKYRSCDRTVATTLRWSGVDASYPVGPVSTQHTYLVQQSNANPKKWTLVGWDYNARSLQSGDVLIVTNGPVHDHTEIVVTDTDMIAFVTGNGEYASDPDWQALLEKAKAGSYFTVSGSVASTATDGRSPSVKVLNSSYYERNDYEVFRCIRPDGSPQGPSSAEAAAYSGLSG